MALPRAAATLFWLTFRRLFWSASTLMVLFPLAGGALFLLRKHYDRIENIDLAFQAFSNFIVIVYVGFLVPVAALAYGTGSLGADREDRTLLFLLMRPVPRWLVALTKFAASLPPALGLTAGGFWLYCRLAGPAGSLAYQLFLPTVIQMTVAYLALFYLFAVVSRHSTIVALIYAFFIELLLGSMPGIVKRVAINYYGRSIMYSIGAADGLTRPAWFEPMSAAEASWTLTIIAAGSLLAALVIFQLREYRDLT
jgi:ABC-2 type transport system permease protein